MKAFRLRCDFLFCHEADIHLTTEDEGLIEQIKSTWQARRSREIDEKRDTVWRKVYGVGR